MCKRNGFTLIELLVVIGIVVFIAILVFCAGVFMLAQKRAKIQANETLCQTNLKQWGLIFSMYTEDNNGYFFSAESDNSGWWWMEPLRPYCKDHKLWLCPMSKEPSKKKVQIPFGDLKVVNNVGDYGLNGWVCNPQEEKMEIWTLGLAENYWRTPNVKGAEKIPLFLDAKWIAAWPRSTDGPPEFENYREGNIISISSQMGHFCINRHNGSINGLFMDWSVRKIGLKELWTLKWYRQFDTKGPWTKAGHVIPEDWPYWMRNFKDY